MALDTLDKVVAVLASGQVLPFQKTGPVTTGGGTLVSCWLATGSPAPGSIPSATACICTDDTVGSMGQILATGTSVPYNVCAFNPYGATVNQWYLYDRLAACGGISHAFIGSSAINIDCQSIANTGRCLSTGADVEWFLEVYTDIGVTACSVVVEWTGSDGTGRSTILAIGGASPLNQDGKLVQIYASVPANVFIRSVEKTRQGLSSAVAGNYGVTVRKRLAFVRQVTANAAGESDWGIIGLPAIMSESCLEIVCMTSTTNVGAYNGHIKVGPTP